MCKGMHSGWNETSCTKECILGGMRQVVQKNALILLESGMCGSVDRQFTCGLIKHHAFNHVRLVECFHYLFESMQSINETLNGILACAFWCLFCQCFAASEKKLLMQPVLIFINATENVLQHARTYLLANKLAFISQNAWCFSSLLRWCSNAHVVDLGFRLLGKSMDG